MRWALELLLEAHGDPMLALDGGCGVGPGVGSLASLVLVFVALAVVMRKPREPRDH
jgi:hypothetical protein